MPTTRYPIRIDDRFRLVLRLFFGVTRDRAWAEIDDDHLTVRLGWWRMEAPLSAVTGWRIEGPWRWITAIGVRSGLGDESMSFAGSARGGVRLDLDPPVRWLIFSVRVLYVGVEDLEGFAADLTRRGIERTTPRDD